jgi:hypothetical protein
VDENADVSDEERIEQIAQRFKILEDMTKAATAKRDYSNDR